MDITEPAPEEGSRLPKVNSGAERKKVIDWLKKAVSNRNGDNTLKSELEELISEHEEESGAPSAENTILRNVLKFDELRVTDVMTPRLDICAVNADIPLNDLKVFIDENEHTRIPIFDKNLDDVIGFIHIKDLMTYWISPKEFKVQEILREILYVPPSMKINNLLVKMQSVRTHMAIVVDEYGGTAGLVTIEDLVEQIVGEIDDEHDEANQEEFIQISENSFEVLARVEIGKLEENLGLKITEDDSHDYDTIGGLIFSILGKIPRIGENINHSSGLVFKVIDADKRRIRRIKITKPV